MTDENICYAIGCRNPGPHRCSRCMLVHYCSRECQTKDFKDGRHKLNCKIYADVAKEHSKRKHGSIALIELREGRIPWCYALEHEKTTKVVVQGVMNIGYKIQSQVTGEFLTHEMNEKLSHKQRREIVLAYFVDWIRDLAFNDPSQLKQALSKSEPVCHECGVAGDLAAAAEAGGLMPDKRWASTKNLCASCYKKNYPLQWPDRDEFEWHIVAHEEDY